jgi:ligand-binding sensor domain-containing protein/two-component sensor histidine kinase
VKSFIGILFICFLSLQGITQLRSGYLVQEVSIKGIPDKTYYTSLLRDPKGFLWIGTFTGLFRYDGYKLNSYTNLPSDTTSLSHNYIYSLAISRNGDLLAGTYGGGLNTIAFSNARSKRINQAVIGQESVVILKTIYSKEDDCYWVASSGHLFKLSTDFKLLWKITMPFIPKPETLIYDIASLARNKILIAGGEGLYVADAAGNSIKKISFPKTKTGIEPDNTFYSITRVGENELWIAGEKGILCVDAKSLLPADKQGNKLLSYFANKQALKTYADHNNNIWIASEGKIIVAKPSTSEISVVKDSLSRVTDIYQDVQGIIWIATRAQGLYKITKPSIQFNVVPGLEAFSKREIVQGSCVESDSTWLIGTNRNLVHFNRQNNEIKKLNIKTKTKLPVFITVFTDSKKNCWISTRNDGSFFRKAGTEEFIPVKIRLGDTSKTVPGFIMDFKENKKGEIWAVLFTTDINLESGLFFYDKTENSFIQKIPSSANGISLTPVANAQLLIDRNGDLWIASLTGGLFQIDISGNTPLIKRNFHIASVPKHRLTLNILSTVIEDKEGNIWAGTVSGGINLYHRDKDSVEYFTIANGLPSNAIYRIEEDDNGFIWISTDNGLSWYDKKINRFINYNSKSGLPSTNFYFLSSFKTHDGLLAFGTSDGNMIFFNPVPEQKEVNKLPVVFSDILLSNQPVKPGDKKLLYKASYLTDTLRLKYSQNVIGFELTNLDLVDPETSSYAYKLDGFDKDWTYISNKNSITYTNLNPGTYTLLVKNANHLGIWNETPTKLTLIISPPWYRTWWFITLLILAITAGAFILFRYRLNQKLKIFAVRQRLHRDLHDDVGATLSSVKAYAEILKGNPDNPVIAELIKDNAAEMIERLEVIAWATNPVHDNFGSLKNRMIKFISPLCHAKKMSCKVESKDINDGLDMPGEFRQNIFLVFKEAVNNTIKYADATNCSASMLIENRNFILQISDNGHGSDGTVKGSGTGWKNMQKRAEELKGQLKIASVPGNGTTITFSVPYPFKIPNTWDKKGNGMN